MRILALLVLALGVRGLSTGASYEAHIRRTSSGLEAIKGAMRGAMRAVRGERSRYFGAGRSDEHLNNDIAMKALNLVEDAGRDLAAQPQEARDWFAGFVAGYNQYLAETGKNNVKGWCKGAEWVAPMHYDIDIVQATFEELLVRFELQ